HHHHSRLLYFLTDPSFLQSQTSNFLNNSVPQPLLPPPQPLITHQPIAVAAVDDCCNECCPAIHPEEANPAEEEYLLNCSWASCTEKFNVTESFIDHLYKQHLHSLRQQQQQQQQQQIQVQTLMPTSVKEKQYQCHWINCQQTLNHLESLLNHVLEVHILGQKNEYYCRWSSCDRIGRPFTQRQKLIRHLQTTHLGFKPFQCDICQKGFSEARLLMQHKRVHTGEKPFSCDQCDKKFSVASALTIHKRTLHSGEKPFICKYCKKKFPESSNLTKHV
ncbi:hypothetical protein BDF20DRAFT_807048, partial [Mycotypha africana]|uniref:uncharacterized protein n=1 Tax=Mycotypha africana TaxID=64632 RepID=UPI0023016AC1